MSEHQKLTINCLALQDRGLAGASWPGLHKQECAFFCSYFGRESGKWADRIGRHWVDWVILCHALFTVDGSLGLHPSIYFLGQKKGDAAGAKF